MSRSLRAAILGFLVGAAGPFLLGIKAWQALGEYAASVRAEGLEVCGLPGIVPLGLFFVVTPFCGLVGAALAPSVAALCASPTVDSEGDLRRP